MSNQLGATVYENVFDALMELPVEGISTASSMAYKQRLLEAAVLGCQKDAPDFAGKIMDRLRTAGLSANKSEIRRELSTLYKTMSRQALPLNQQQTLFDDLLADVPGDEELIVPPGWLVSNEGIHRVGSSGEDESGLRTILAPVVPVELLISLDNGTESVRLAWLLDGFWQERVVNRETVADARKLVSLAAHGCPVTSNSASTLVDYLADCLAVNRARLPKRSLSNHLGWHTVGGQECFLLGQSTIRGASQAEVQLEFDRTDDGYCQVADAFYTRGTLDGWLEAIRRVCDYSCIRFVIAAAFVPPLLEILDAPNFCIDLCNQTSRGKTTALRLAASVWGCPDERARSTVLHTWDATRVFIERAAAIGCDLPFFLDDTKRARKEFVSPVIYDISGGRGRGRGTREGVQSSVTCRTVLFSNGEAPATSFSEDGGAYARTLTFWGLPFGATDDATGAVVDQANADVLEHFGHAGPYFVKYVIDHQGEWPSWKNRYAELRERFNRLTKDRPVARRIVAYVAMICLAAELAHAAGVMPGEYEDPISPVWNVLAAESEEAERDVAALQLVLSWAVGNRDRFWQTSFNKSGKSMPTQGWAGHWDDGPARNLGFLSPVLDKVLKDAGYDPKAILNSWRDRGWLHLSKDGKGKMRPQWRVGVAGVKTWLVALTPAAQDTQLQSECEDFPYYGEALQTQLESITATERQPEPQSDVPDVSDTVVEAIVPPQNDPSNRTPDRRKFPTPWEPAREPSRQTGCLTGGMSAPPTSTASDRASDCCRVVVKPVKSVSPKLKKKRSHPGEQIG